MAGGPWQKTIPGTSLKHQHILEQIRGDIIQGVFKPGEKLPSQNEMARTLGVSPNTVREAVSSLVHEGLVTRIQGKATYVSQQTKTGTVSIIAEAKFMGRGGTMFDEILVDTSLRCVRESGFRPVLAVGSGESEEEFLSSIHLFDGTVLRDTLGVINTVVGLPVEARLAEAGIPMVGVASHIPLWRYSAILGSAAAYNLAVEELIARGRTGFSVMHMDIAQHVWGKTAQSNQQEDLWLLRRAVDFDDRRIVSVPFDVSYRDFEAAYDAFTEWWGRTDRPSALLIVDDNVIGPVGRAISHLGIRVPQELAVVAFTNVGLERPFPVELTRVEFDPGEMMRAAWEMLSTLIGGNTPPDSVVRIQPRLVEGKSL